MTTKTDTKTSSLIINELTKEQYTQALAEGQINEDELYLVTGEEYTKGEIDKLVKDVKDELQTKIDLKPNNADVVHKEGVETITGVKNFTGGSSGSSTDVSLKTLNALAVGDETQTNYTGIYNHRKCSGDSNLVNTAGFLVNSDGSAKFTHKKGTTTAVGTADDSYIVFNSSKLIYSNTGNSTDEKSILHEGNVKTINGESIKGSGNITIKGGVSSFSEITGQPSDNTNLKNALDSKQPIGDYATNERVDTVEGAIPSIEGLATETYVNNHHDNTKQDVISNLSTIESNAQAGKSASDTIANYGNIVTHNTNEFQVAGDYATNSKVTEVETTANNAKAIAEGKATGYVFDTKEAMDSWIQEHSSELKLGDNLYIRAVDVPDYWWDGIQAQQLETQKVDLTDYYTIETIDGLLLLKQDNLVSGINIKTINNQSILGEGNIKIEGGGTGSISWGKIGGTLTAQTDLKTALDNKTQVIIRSW